MKTKQQSLWQFFFFFGNGSGQPNPNSSQAGQWLANSSDVYFLEMRSVKIKLKSSRWSRISIPYHASFEFEHCSAIFRREINREKYGRRGILIRGCGGGGDWCRRVDRRNFVRQTRRVIRINSPRRAVRRELCQSSWIIHDVYDRRHRRYNTYGTIYK